MNPSHVAEKVSHRAPSSALSPLNKGIGLLGGGLGLDELPKLGWNLLKEDLALPAAVISSEKLDHNLKWMQAFASAYGAKLAPHGKTTMAPRLFQRQMEAGAWGITLATAHQTRVAYEHGIGRVLMANQLVGKQNMATIAQMLENAEFEFYCLVDSSENTNQLGTFFREHGLELNVLLELGVEGGRTGVRNREQLDSVLEALSHWPKTLIFCGLEIYEGILNDERAIRSYLHRALDTTRELVRDGRFQRGPVILSGAGSSWYDVVADVFGNADVGAATEVILRPGCYLTHDVGAYRSAQERILGQNPVAQQMQPALEPALQVWAYVQSIPERERAIVGMGKRDAAFDAALPVPALHYRPSWPEPMKPPQGWTLTRIMDQHSFLQIEEGADIHVGDMIAFDISHPCLTFDKWRFLSIVDASYRVIDIVETFF
ncbi:MAG TPA: amino acid deaminase [Terriglobales bacterium]|nr:amino acid deaminase [Terriglobales bacterium]